MIKQHVFALSLALFVSGATLDSTSNHAQASTNARHYYKCIKRNGKTVCYPRHRPVVKSVSAVASSDSGVINVADNYVGLNESNGHRSLMDLFDVSFEQNIDPRSTPWCAAFANSVLAKTGKTGTGSLMAASFLTWGEPTDNPKHGDIVVLSLQGKASHVGFYLGTVRKNGRTYVKVLGGNQGDAVKITWYPASSVVQYRTG